MRSDNAPSPVTVHKLADYRPPAWRVTDVELGFDLDPQKTRVVSHLLIEPNPRGNGPEDTLFLHGERLELIRVSINGRDLSADDYGLSETGLTLKGLLSEDQGTPIRLETEVRINPSANTSLEGLYLSGGRFCTQCEAEGFRRITFMMDQPDVLARYRVTLRAETRYARLLSNGNRIEQGTMPDGRHYAVWEDPFPKPSYLFALVAGELDLLADHFTTASGRNVALELYVDPGQSSRAAYALGSLKRAMAWDEAVYGREYDLDLFMIVAVRDFNFGAMENKGLNIFNAALLLADPQTATDPDYERIESVVAHEYFHNWSGNRVTCRDWFQLCLKEGLTVYRDQGFSADMRGEAVQRIKDVKALRARQFAEDGGPLAHPVRPDSYEKIDNFYTATIYEKGAELVGMLRTLVGPETYRKALDHYFAANDGTAATVEDFISAFETVTGQSFASFMPWYTQAGTPRVTARSTWSPNQQTLDIFLSQSTPDTPGQPSKQPVPIPIRLGLLSEDGSALLFNRDTQTGLSETVFVLDQAEARLRLEGVRSRPVLSLLRGFSAPVSLSLEEPTQDLFVRMGHDPDLFNRWEAAQTLAAQLIRARASDQPDSEGEAAFALALGRTLEHARTDPAFAALMLQFPSEQDLSLTLRPADPLRLHAAREYLMRICAEHLEAAMLALYAQLAPTEGAFRADAHAAGTRTLRNSLLDLLAILHPTTEARTALIQAHITSAKTLSEEMGGMLALMRRGGSAWTEALDGFYSRWNHEPLVLDKWFALQARNPAAGCLDAIMALTCHPDFDYRTPNRMRAVLQTFASVNPVAMHAQDGRGYQWLAEQIAVVDALNPASAARLVDPLGHWGRFSFERGQQMRAALSFLLSRESLSPNVREQAAKAIAGSDH
ncbi:MAG: aminopeptidase N [Asticcacaulis sp.]